MSEPIPRATTVYDLQDQDLSREVIERRLSTLEFFQANPLQSLYFSAVSVDPVDPEDGSAVIWMSDGTDTGDNGDVLIKITAGGVTKIASIVDFNEV